MVAKIGAAGLFCHGPSIVTLSSAILVLVAIAMLAPNSTPPHSTVSEVSGPINIYLSHMEREINQSLSQQLVGICTTVPGVSVPCQLHNLWPLNCPGPLTLLDRTEQPGWQTDQRPVFACLPVPPSLGTRTPVSGWPLHNHQLLRGTPDLLCSVKALDL